MTLSLKPEHLKRYGEIGRLLIRYGRSDLVSELGIEAELQEQAGEATAVVPPQAEQLANDLEEMGPTFIKLGQLLSTRTDVLPLPYAEALSRLQDDVEPFAFEEVEAIVAEELGVRLSKAFQRFDRAPIAAASLGQVHRAALRDGREVAVKVQRPGIRKRIADDLDSLEELADFLDRRTEVGRRYEFGPLLEQFRKSLIRELDYRQEAGHLEKLRANLAEFGRLVVPRPVEDYTTSRVLTMEYVSGRKITDLSPLSRMEMDGGGLADELFQAYLKQILVDGFFHADPHPGNVFVTDEGRIALIDLGMIGRIAPEMQERLLKLILAIAEGRADEAAEVALAAGQLKEHHDEDGFRSTVAELVVENQESTASDIEVGRVVVQLTRSAADHGIRLPPELTMLGKALLNLDQVGRTLDPTFEPNEAIRRHSADLLRRRMLKSASPGQMFSSMLELHDFTRHLPGRLNRLLDKAVEGEVTVRVDATPPAKLIEGMQKIANRITLGLVLAAMIVGAAMLMQVETALTFFGYPALAILLFLAAATGGLMLVVNILLHDRDSR
jgi:ubiquinone biosynthesis protein